MQPLTEFLQFLCQTHLPQIFSTFCRARYVFVTSLVSGLGHLFKQFGLNSLFLCGKLHSPAFHSIGTGKLYSLSTIRNYCNAHACIAWYPYSR